MLGSFAGKAVLQRMSLPAFHPLLDALLVCAGLSLRWAAFA